MSTKKLIRNRCANRSNVIGSAVVTLDGTVDGRRPIESVFDPGDIVRYVVEEPGEDPAWEMIEGVLVAGSPPRLTRVTTLGSSSPSGDAIAFSTSPGKLVFVDVDDALVGPERGRLNIATTTGTGAAYELDLPVPPQQLKDGVEVHFFVHTDNTQSDVTLKVGLTDPKPLRRGLPKRKLAVGSMKTDALITARYSEAGGGTWNIRVGLVKTVKVIAATPYVVLEEDHEQILIFNVAGAVAAAVPQATGQFAAPFEFDYQNMGSGTVTFTPATSTINTLATLDAIIGQGGRCFAVGANYRSTQAPVAKNIQVPVRQTVLSGPVTAAGLPNFGGATGSATVTQAGTLIVTAANGFDANGEVDRVGSIVNASWTGLNTNGTMFLYLDIAADGTCTPGSTTLAPVYQFGGAYSNTNGQFVFNTQEMVGKVGSGAANAQAYRVFVGEVTVAGAVVTAITWYALLGRYRSADTSTLPGSSTSVSFNHNLGTTLIQGSPELQLECIATDAGCAVGDIMTRPMSNDTTIGAMSLNYLLTGRNAMQISTGNGSAFTALPKAGGGPVVGLTAAKWKYRMMIDRGW